MKPIVATWILLDSADEASYYPQTGVKSSASTRVHEIYWRCVACFFATAFRITGNACRFVLYTSGRTLAPLDVHSILAEAAVEIEYVPLTYLPPQNYLTMWRNQFYILDIIRHLVTDGQVTDCLVLDSDCLFVSGLSPVFERLRTEEVLTYSLELPLTEDINGLTRLQMRDLFGELFGRRLEEPPEYFGGEIFAANARGLRRLNEEIDLLWEQCMRRAAAGQLKLNEEAHFLSYLYLKLGYGTGTANDFIRRIWTQRRYRDGVPGDLNLPIWHVPAEKRFGFRALYATVLDRNSWFWRLPANETWRLRLAQLMGIPRPNQMKRVRDLSRSLWEKLRPAT